ncbi:hypothetical protein DFS33DRAFT_1277404 [Desarmillaria ectypa]|nr:hypothetical protein DFS33DRAFT_1277404 [Desarmillaria ectypa]
MSSSVPLSGDEHQQVAFVLGMSLDLFYQGILTAQFANYYSWYGSKDGIGMKIAVGVLALMTTLKSVQVSLRCQLQRGISSRPSGLANYFNAGSTAHTLCFPLAADVLLSSSTAWFLLKNRKHVIPQTASLLNALVRLTFQTAALPAICAMINLIFVYTKNNYSKNVVSVFIQALPKLYAISMMWTLNARRAIRVAFASGGREGTSTEEAVPRNVERTRRDEVPE